MTTRTIAEATRHRGIEDLVGRERELTKLLALLESDRTFVAYVHGVAGIGKSSLLNAFAANARQSGATVTALDGHTMEPTDRGFLAALARAIGARGGGGVCRLTDRLADLGSVTVLSIDHYEVLRLIDTPGCARSSCRPCPTASGSSSPVARRRLPAG
jgi:ribosome biogenesis GTPase A